MSSNESDSSVNSSESSSKIDTRSDGDTNTSESEYHVASQNLAYDDEPLAEPGQDVDIIPYDADGLPPSVLEERSDGRMPLNQW
jgi:hypothetical protein